MYISRNSIVIKTNYETRRRDRGVARRRAGAHAKKLGKHPLPSSNWQTIQLCPIADRQTDRIIFDSRPDERPVNQNPDLSPRREEPTMPSRDHPSDL